MNIMDFGHNSLITWTRESLEAEKENEMREIKFRAWDKEKEVMIYPGTENQQWDYFLLTLQGEICLYDTDDYGKTGLWEHNIEYKKDRFILMQFTGLKDKNGKDLDWWKDDLLRKGPDHSCAPIGRIMYDTRKAQWVIVGKSGGEFCGLLQAYKNGWEKFSNIHQHPKLLEKDDGS